MIPTSRVVAFLAAAVFAVVPACGSDDAGSTAPPEATGSTAPPEATGSTAPPEATGSTAPPSRAEGPQASSLPSLEMTDAATGGKVSLDAALTSADGRPVLAWFWAPYCPTCRAEAPGLDAFVAEHGDEVQVVGIGTRNDLEQARDFLSDTGVENFPLLWEDTGEAWTSFGVTAQPYMILLDGDEVVARWPGGADDDEILAEVAELS